MRLASGSDSLGTAAAQARTGYASGYACLRKHWLIATVEAITHSLPPKASAERWYLTPACIVDLARRRMLCESPDDLLNTFPPDTCAETVPEQRYDFDPFQCWRQHPGGHLPRAFFRLQRATYGKKGS